MTDKLESHDPFDPTALRLDPSFTDGFGIKEDITTILARKPQRQSFIRVHPGAAYRLDTAVIELKEEGETYLLNKDMQSALAGEIVPVTLFTVIARPDVLFLWPVKLPRDSGRANSWNQSALAAAEKAMKNWVRIVADMNLGAYRTYVAVGGLAEPVWPELTFKQILEIAFRDHFITSLDHPVVKRLQGKA